MTTSQQPCRVPNEGGPRGLNGEGGGRGSKGEGGGREGGRSGEREGEEGNERKLIWGGKRGGGKKKSKRLSGCNKLKEKCYKKSRKFTAHYCAHFVWCLEQISLVSHSCCPHVHRIDHCCLHHNMSHQTALRYKTLQHTV